MSTRLEETLLRVVDATRFGAVAVSDDRRLAFLTLDLVRRTTAWFSRHLLDGV